MKLQRKEEMLEQTKEAWFKKINSNKLIIHSTNSDIQMSCNECTIIGCKLCIRQKKRNEVKQPNGE